VNVTALVVAKAPVPGLAKTRLAATLGDAAAADIAAAALLDTLDAVAAAEFSARIIALTGDFAQASRREELQAAFASYTVVEQRGDGLRSGWCMRTPMPRVRPCSRSAWTRRK